MASCAIGGYWSFTAFSDPLPSEEEFSLPEMTCYMNVLNQIATYGDEQTIEVLALIDKEIPMRAVSVDVVMTFPLGKRGGFQLPETNDNGVASMTFTLTSELLGGETGAFSLEASFKSNQMECTRDSGKGTLF